MLRQCPLASAWRPSPRGSAPRFTKFNRKGRAGDEWTVDKDEEESRRALRRTPTLARWPGAMIARELLTAAGVCNGSTLHGAKFVGFRLMPRGAGAGQPATRTVPPAQRILLANASPCAKLGGLIEIEASGARIRIESGSGADDAFDGAVGPPRRRDCAPGALKVVLTTQPVHFRKLVRTLRRWSRRRLRDAFRAGLGNLYRTISGVSA